VDSEKGYEEVIVFAYTIQHEIAMNRNLFPNYKPEFNLPEPEIVPLPPK